MLSAAQDARATAADRRVDPAALTGRHKGRSSKEERLAKVHEGREGRDFGAAAARKKQKTGGTSNKQKARACPPDRPACCGAPRPAGRAASRLPGIAHAQIC